jgi:hypothetical protein
VPTLVLDEPTVYDPVDREPLPESELEAWVALFDDPVQMECDLSCAAGGVSLVGSTPSCNRSPSCDSRVFCPRSELGRMISHRRSFLDALKGSSSNLSKDVRCEDGKSNQRSTPQN